MGNRFTVYYEAYKYYKNNLKNKVDFDLIVEEVNTIPFFSKFYAKPKKHYLFFHQLAREIWFYQMMFPISLIGYLLEPLYLYLLSKSKVITISGSTKNDLIKYNFKKENISIVSEGVDVKAVADLNTVQKYIDPTLLSLGAVRPMKRTHDILKAFEISKVQIPNLKIIFAGDDSGSYGTKLKEMIYNSRYKSDITLLGRVTPEKKTELMTASHLICVTSIKEGWGLIVTEANRRGTPAIAYNVDGLRDSVRNDMTGLLTKTNAPHSLAESVNKALLDNDNYGSMRVRAHSWSKEITFEKQYSDFLKLINN
jgi:glycosyltransferase involved in cell wall biosynthesis